jgi:hypothetical protein
LLSGWFFPASYDNNVRIFNLQKKEPIAVCLQMNGNRIFFISILTIFTVLVGCKVREAAYEAIPVPTELETVPDIEAETSVGRLPPLPYVIPTVYRDSIKGPDVRVIWPSPKDNNQVLKPGVYVLTGRVPGTLRFKIGDIDLKPFYESYDRYSVYLRIISK